MNKKITFLASLLVASSALAQKMNVSERMAKSLTAEKPASVPGSPAKALGTTFWSDDFSNASNWSIDNNAQSGATFGWSIAATENSWYFTSPINSTSDGNFAMLSNGNPAASPATQALNVVYTMTTANPIPLSNGTNVILSFQQYGARFNDLQEVQISTNGTTFVTVQNNNDHDALSQAGGAAYTNPENRSVNISSYLSGQTEVWIRFRWTTNYPASATNPNVWVTYGWFIDDVALTTSPDYDLEITDNYWGSVGLNYYQIPSTQVAPIDYSINVKSNGLQAMTNVQYGVAITGAGTFNGTSASGTVAPGTTNDSLFLTTQFTPSAVGTYNVTPTLMTTETDDVPTNNAIAPYSFAVTNYIYARDNGVASGYTSNATDPFETGNFFDIFADQTLKGVDVRLATGTPTGASAIEFYVRIYQIDINGDLVYVTESPQIMATAAMLNSNYTVYLGSPIQLTAGTTYLVMVGSYSAGLRVANAGTSYDQTSFLLDGNDIDLSSLYYQTSTPWVRLNFDPSLGVEELTSATGINVYPNPFSTETAINFTLKNDAEVSVVVTDLAGRVVSTVPATSMNAGEQTINIDGTSFVAGVYNYTLQIGNEVITKRIVKK